MELVPGPANAMAVGAPRIWSLDWLQSNGVRIGAVMALALVSTAGRSYRPVAGESSNPTLDDAPATA